MFKEFAGNRFHIPSIKIKGYRPFADFFAKLSQLEVIVGANGSGKSSLFEFLKFLRESIYREIPPEIVAGSIGQQIFHRPGPDKFWWCIELDFHQPSTLYYEGELLGPVGRTRVSFEKVISSTPFPGYTKPSIFMDIKGQKGIVNDPLTSGFKSQEWMLKKANQLAVSTVTNPSLKTLFDLREFISGWRFYSSFNINNARIRQSVPISQDPVLYEDAGNLSAVLFNLMSEHPRKFNELKVHLRSAVPGFDNLTVKARGGPGEVIAFWQEKDGADDLSLADLSDGILRFLCWVTLCIMPNPPGLICIDEPDQGVHPRTLPILAGLFQKASQRTQILIASHASYFLTQFDIPNIAVMKNVNGQSVYLKPGDSKALCANLEDFGIEELENMHRSDELEALV